MALVGGDLAVMLAYRSYQQYVGIERPIGGPALGCDRGHYASGRDSAHAVVVATAGGAP